LCAILVLTPRNWESEKVRELELPGVGRRIGEKFVSAEKDSTQGEGSISGSGSGRGRRLHILFWDDYSYRQSQRGARRQPTGDRVKGRSEIALAADVF
jgi:hypothetical protein